MQNSSSTVKQHKILSASDIARMTIPEITYYVEGILRPGGKATIVAKKKMAKSFLAIDWGLHISEGREYLGFKTTQCNVLYINFEISEEKLMERIQDTQRIRGFRAPRFKAFTKLEGMKLDIDTNSLMDLLNVCDEGNFPVHVLILDPRIKSMERNENESAVVNSYTKHLDQVMNFFPGLSVLIVHHEGKSTTGAGRGHSSYDGWVDTIIKIRPVRSNLNFNGEDLPLAERKLIIEGRDIESQELGIVFRYPIHDLAPEAITDKASKVKMAGEFILQEVKVAGEITQSELRFKCIGARHSDYSFYRALAELKERGQIKESKAEGQGHRKLLSAPQ